MTPRQIALVREGFERVAPMAEDFGMTVYRKLFELDPSLRALFADDIRPQVGHFMAAVTMVVRSLDDLTPVLARVRGLGRAHASYGIKTSDFGTAGAALLAALEAGLGGDFTDEAQQAWTTAYTTLADAMMAAMGEVTRAAA